MVGDGDATMAVPGPGFGDEVEAGTGVAKAPLEEGTGVAGDEVGGGGGVAVVKDGDDFGLAVGFEGVEGGEEGVEGTPVVDEDGGDGGGVLAFVVEDRVWVCSAGCWMPLSGAVGLTGVGA